MALWRGLFTVPAKPYFGDESMAKLMGEIRVGPWGRLDDERAISYIS
jgi:hypothetical protein